MSNDEKHLQEVEKKNYGTRSAELSKRGQMGAVGEVRVLVTAFPAAPRPNLLIKVNNDSNPAETILIMADLKT